MRIWRQFAVTTLAAAAACAAQGQQVVNALCSTDLGWCELAAKEFQAATGIKVNQARKATGEALAQIRAEASNPKTDLWWGGTATRSCRLPNWVCSRPIVRPTWTTCTAGRCASTR